MSAIAVPSQQSRAINGVPIVGQPSPGPLILTNSGTGFIANRALLRSVQYPNNAYSECYYSDNTVNYCEYPPGCCQQTCCGSVASNNRYLPSSHDDPHAENIGMGAVWVVVAMGIFVFLLALGLLGWCIYRQCYSKPKEKVPSTTYVSYQGSTLTPTEEQKLQYSYQPQQILYPAY